MDYKITANREQLNDIGIDFDITGLTGELQFKFPTGWYLVKITHKIDGIEFTNDFDIPKIFLEEITMKEETKEIIQRVMSSDLTDDEIKIIKIQKTLKALGYQWEEHIFNDDILSAGCYLEICKTSKKPSVFRERKDDAGWGRFSRLRCWKYALEFAEQQF